MATNSLLLKNYISQFVKRLKDGEEIWPTEQMDFLNEVSKFITNVDSDIDYLAKRLDELEKQKTSASGGTNPTSYDSFVKTVMNKIEILKNIIKKKMPDNDLFSLSLTEVESIEKDIQDSGQVTRRNLEKLNEIYILEKKSSI